METRKGIAAEKKRCGSHNCTQAVLCTYHDFTGIDEGNIKNAGNAFAAGMGTARMRVGVYVYHEDEPPDVKPTTRAGSAKRRKKT